MTVALQLMLGGRQTENKEEQTQQTAHLNITQFIQHLPLNMYRCCDENNNSNFQSSHEE